jgi:outer membrane protein assembly factor BamB
LALSLVVVLFVPVVGMADTSGVQSGKGWRYRVVADNLLEVDDLGVGSDGSVYASQVLAGGKGRVIRLRNGQPDAVISGLEHPGGILLKGRHLYLTEQVNEGRVIKLHLDDGRPRVFEGLRNPEHLALLPDGDILVTEDILNGRITRLSASGATEVVTSGFNGVEGLAIARDGTIFIGESNTGRVLAYKNGGISVVVDDLNAPGQIECAPDGALWITERAESGRLLRLKDDTLETVLNGLSDPRGIALGGNGAVYVAERGRSRILIVEPKP